MNSNQEIRIERLSKASIKDYIGTGIKSYRQHYLHLWPNQDPTPYIESSFTAKVVEGEMADANNRHFVIFYKEAAAGILKIVLDSPVKGFSKREAMFLEKVYLLKAYSGKGLGGAVLKFVLDYSRKLGKKALWLCTMQKGPALQFYLKNGFTIVEESLLSLKGAIEEERPMYLLVKRI